MNKQRRKKLDSIHRRIVELSEEIQAVTQDEQDSLDNMPESLQEGERGQRMQDIVSDLESASDNLQEAAEILESVIEE